MWNLLNKTFFGKQGIFLASLVLISNISATKLASPESRGHKNNITKPSISKGNELSPKKQKTPDPHKSMKDSQETKSKSLIPGARTPNKPITYQSFAKKRNVNLSLKIEPRGANFSKVSDHESPRKTDNRRKSKHIPSTSL